MVNRNKITNCLQKLKVHFLFNYHLILFFVLIPGLYVVASAQTVPNVCTVQCVEYPGNDPVMWSALYAARDGKVYTGLCSEGTSAHFYQYDPAKNAHRCLYDMAEFLGERGKGIRTAGKIHCQPVEDNEGNIYFTTVNNGSGPVTIDFTSWQGGHWLRYNPRKDQLEDLGLIDKGVGSYPLVIDANRNYLFALGFTGYLYRFDIVRKVTKNLGRVDNWDICRDIVCDGDGNVYGCFPVARVWKYDAQKERVNDLSVRIPFDPTMFPTQLKNPMIDRSVIWRAVEWGPIDKSVYGVTCGSGSILFKLDPNKGTEGEVTQLTQLCDSKFLNSERKDIPYSTLAFTLDWRNRKIFFAPSARSYSIGGYAETFGSSELHHLILYDLKTNQRKDLGALQTTDGRKVFGSEAAACGPDGTVYLCAQVEVKDPQKATAKVGSTPVAMHLLIYKP